MAHEGAWRVCYDLDDMVRDARARGVVIDVLLREQPIVDARRVFATEQDARCRQRKPVTEDGRTSFTVCYSDAARRDQS
jgi:hypothetical protein